MKRIAFSVFLALLALGILAGTASAQGNKPPFEGRGLLHEYIEQALADKLGLSLAEVEAQFEAGKTLWQIALDNGIAEADLPVFVREVHEAAFAAAVADGVITQAQADWMLQRMARYGYGIGHCLMGASGLRRGPGMPRGGGWSQARP